MALAVARNCRRAPSLSNTCTLLHRRFLSSFSSRRQDLGTIATKPDHEIPSLNIRRVAIDSSKRKQPDQARPPSETSSSNFLSAADKEKQIKDPLQNILGHEAASIILRDACKCAKCVDSSTSQRDFNVADIPIDIEPASFSQDERGNLTVTWRNDMPGWENHTSNFTPSQLSKLQKGVQPTHQASTWIWDRQTYERNKVDIDFEEYMTNNDALASTLHGLAKFGLVYIKNVPEDEQTLHTIAERIGERRSTFYGSSWDVRSIPQAKNVAYTSKYLGFHSDLLYLKETPGVQLLHCLQNSCTGGESRFVDQLKALDVFLSECPDLWQPLINTSLRYEYDNDGFYYTDIKPIVQFTQHSQYFGRRQLRGSSHSELRDVDRFYWGPTFMGSIVQGPGIQIEQSLRAMKKYAEILEREDLVYQEKMEPGTCVVFNNLRVLHARNQFDANSGRRWLRGTYVDAQDVWSKELALSEYVSQLDRQEFPAHA